MPGGPLHEPSFLVPFLAGLTGGGVAALVGPELFFPSLPLPTCAGVVFLVAFGSVLGATPGVAAGLIARWAAGRLAGPTHRAVTLSVAAAVALSCAGALAGWASREFVLSLFASV